MRWHSPVSIGLCRSLRYRHHPFVGGELKSPLLQLLIVKNILWGKLDMDKYNQSPALTKSCPVLSAFSRAEDEEE